MSAMNTEESPAERELSQLDASIEAAKAAGQEKRVRGLEARRERVLTQLTDPHE
jgi:hypothetical protein